MIIVMTTVPDRSEAEALARGLISHRLAACVQILPEMTSVYRWEGEIQRESELLLLIKSDAGRYDEIEEFIKSSHSYDVPEIASVEADRVSEAYASWLGESVMR